MAAVALPENWLTLTSRFATVAETPGIFRLPESPVPCRPNQLAPDPSLSAAALMLPLVMARPKLVVPIARLSWLKAKASSGWFVTAGLVNVTGAFDRLKCIDPLKRLKTLSEVRSPSAARIAVVRPTPVPFSAVCVQSMAAVALPENWLTLTSRFATVAVTPGMFRLPESPVPCRPNQLAPAPSDKAAAFIEPLVICTPKLVVPIARLSWLKAKASKGWFVTAGLVSVTKVLLRLKCIDPLRRLNTLSDVRSPSAARIAEARPTPVPFSAVCVQSMAAVALPENWLTLTSRFATVAVTPGMFRLPESPVPCRPTQLAPAPSDKAAAFIEPLVMARPKLVVPIARLSWLKAKASKGWFVTAGLVSVTKV